MLARFWPGAILLIGSVLPNITADATETVTYSYDELGRLVESSITDSASNVKAVQIALDAAGNRSNYSVSEAFLSISDASVTEGGDLVFTISRTGNLSLAVTLEANTVNGTAYSPLDYTALVDEPVTIAANASSTTVTVETHSNWWYEPTETMSLELSNPSAGASIEDASGTGTIYNS